MAKKTNERNILGAIITQLPTKKGIGINSQKNVIDWDNCVGLDVEIEYKYQRYIVKILKHNKTTRKLTIKYLDNTEIEIATYSFAKGQYGGILGLHTKEYNHNIGDVITSNNRHLKIIEQIRINGRKLYKYECLSCGNVDTISEGNLKVGKGCNACGKSPNKVIKEINSVWKTNPELIKYFENPIDAELYTISSSKKVWFKCPRCGERKFSTLNNMSKKLKNHNFPCEKCGDNKSYPEKFMFNMLQQSEIDFTTQKKFKWSQNKLYDFYIPSLKCIIETHGMQHYKDTNISRNKGRTFKEEYENDMLKNQLAKDNGIEYYIAIDCRESELEYIKNSILNSLLTKLLNLNTIDWLKCHEYACCSLVKKCCDLWNDGIKNTEEIGKIVGVNRNGVTNYLKQGAKLNWCDYDVAKIMEEVYKKFKLYNKVTCGKPLICLDNEMIFKSLKDCEQKSIEVFNKYISRQSIGGNCNGKSKTSKGLTFKYISNLSDEEKERYEIDNKIKYLYSEEEIAILDKQ